MFRSIQSSVKKRKDFFQTTTNNQREIDTLLTDFLNTIFGSAARHVKIQAKLEQQNLFIQTTNKTVANELLFQSRALYKFLKEKNISCEKIVIQ